MRVVRVARVAQGARVARVAKSEEGGLMFISMFIMLVAHVHVHRTGRFPPATKMRVQ